ncbi:MAG: hypothetical protein OEZ39_19885 [Gammaproteobacteria bacterium]|nr:hypothetical protein [Gammaproteobacteria bacterium]MDH5654129.1 hypothetical protein [Gammaproteobacteria bacterium]
MKIYRSVIFAVLFCIPALVVAGTPASTTSFLKNLRDQGITLSMPDGFSETPVISNMNVRYDFALKNVKTGVEIRYALRPHKGNVMLGNRAVALPFFETALMNITHSEKMVLIRCLN